jgi:tRNA modification GTPase
MRESPSSINVLTPPGRGAVAVVACTGDIAILDGANGSPPLCIARDGRLFQGRLINQITFARWGTDHPEDVVVCRTSDNEFEIHCHGGRAAVERIRNDLDESRCSTSLAVRNDQHEREWPPELQRMLDLAWGAVTRATTLRTADMLLTLATEAWPGLGRLYPARGSGHFREYVGECLRWADFGRHLTEPWTVAIAGKPNAGKSSLMNALAGFQRSIVNPTPGTTRDAVTLDVAFDGWPVRLVDTAGLRISNDELESAGIERAQREIEKADLILHVCDLTDEPVEQIPNSLFVLNKLDLTPTVRWSDVDAVAVSAVTGDGIELLIERIVGRLIPDELPGRKLPVPTCEEQVAFLRDLYERRL